MQSIDSAAWFVVLAACLLTAGSTVDVTGAWTGEIKDQEGYIGHIRFVLKQTGGQITGAAGAEQQTDSAGDIRRETGAKPSDVFGR